MIEGPLRGKVDISAPPRLRANKNQWLRRSRSATDFAWAGKPSALASATVAGPSSRSAASSSARKLVRFMKSSTDKPLANRARRRVPWCGERFWT